MATQPVVLQVLGEEDRRHAAAPELALDAIPIGHHGLEAIGGEGHGGSGGGSPYPTTVGSGGPAWGCRSNPSDERDPGPSIPADGYRGSATMRANCVLAPSTIGRKG